MSISVEIGLNIVSLRKERGITQEKLALNADMSVSYLRHIEHGFANPSLKTLHRIADALEVPIDHIVTSRKSGDSAFDCV